MQDEATRKTEKFEVRLNADKIRIWNSKKDLILNEPAGSVGPLVRVSNMNVRGVPCRSAHSILAKADSIRAG